MKSSHVRSYPTVGVVLFAQKKGIPGVRSSHVRSYPTVGAVLFAPKKGIPDRFSSSREELSCSKLSHSRGCTF